MVDLFAVFNSDIPAVITDIGFTMTAIIGVVVVIMGLGLVVRVLNPSEDHEESNQDYTDSEKEEGVKVKW